MPPLGPTDPARGLSLDRIIRAVAAAAGVTPLEIRSHRRNRRAVVARHAAMWLARRATRHSYPAIGRAFERDHTSVIYGVSRIERQMDEDLAFAAWVRSLETATQ